MGSSAAAGKDEGMVPRAVQDAGYTAVGLGVLVLQQVQKRRRKIAHKVSTELNAAGRQAQTVLTEVKTKAAPMSSRLEDLPRLPGPIGQVLETGRSRLCAALQPWSN